MIRALGAEIRDTLETIPIPDDLALTLIEAIAGRDRAEAVAHDLGLTRWDARHDNGAFTLTLPRQKHRIRVFVRQPDHEEAPGLWIDVKAVPGTIGNIKAVSR